MNQTPAYNDPGQQMTPEGEYSFLVTSKLLAGPIAVVADGLIGQLKIKAKKKTTLETPNWIIYDVMNIIYKFSQA